MSTFLDNVLGANARHAEQPGQLERVPNRVDFLAFRVRDLPEPARADALKAGESEGDSVTAALGFWGERFAGNFQDWKASGMVGGGVFTTPGDGTAWIARERRIVALYRRKPGEWMSRRLDAPGTYDGDFPHLYGLEYGVATCRRVA